jgi:hypothetical protein
VDAEQRYEQIAGDLVARGLAGRAKMFGMPSLKARGKAIGGFFNGDMVFKLTDEASRSAALALEEAHPFDPMGGRPMKEWVQVPAAHADEWPRLAEEAAVTPPSG